MWLQTIGIHSDVNLFKTRKKAEDFVAPLVTLGQPLLPIPSAATFTNESASKATASTGWGVHI